MRTVFSTPLAPVPLLLGALLLAWALAPLPAPAAEEDEPVLLGEELSRAEIEEAVPHWVIETDTADVDADAAAALARVEPGAKVTVFLGTWCSDSARELPRFWRALDEISATTDGHSPPTLPFEIEYVGVDRDKTEPLGRVMDAALEFVPTFVVTRGGREVGRVVEESPGGIENDLLALLRGEASGTISAREDL